MEDNWVMTPNAVARRIIDDLAEGWGLSREEVTRRAFALLLTVQQAEASGLVPALIDAEGQVVSRLVFREGE
jgi:hypothetical protein